MRSGWVWMAGAVLAAGTAFGQAAPAAAAASGPTFDVASVKLAAPIDQATMIATLRSASGRSRCAWMQTVRRLRTCR